MMPGEHPPPTPPHATFAALRREYDDDAGLAIDVEPPPGAPPRFARRTSGSLADWVSATLGDGRGVVAALPRTMWPASSSTATTLSNRLVALDATRAVGRNAWWLRALQSTPFAEALSFALDEVTEVHVTSGVQFPVDWIPLETSYGGEIDVDGYEAHTVAGIAVQVRHTRHHPATVAASRMLQQRLLFELEAGASGIGPAILATFAVHDDDDFSIGAQLPHAAAPVSELTATASPTSTGLAAIVSVTQAHAFRLHDLLRTYDVAQTDPLLRPCVVGPQITATISEATASVARKVRALATTRTLKLNVSPINTVFVPKLVENDDGELEASGYGFYDGHRESTKGVPALLDFNPQFVRRFPQSATAYSADGAYAAGMLALLAHCKTQYADVHTLMLRKLCGMSAEGAALPDDELPENFEAEISLPHALQRMRESGALAGFGALLRAQASGDAAVAAAFEEVATDLATLGAAPLDNAHAGMSVFVKLTQLVSGLERVDTAILSHGRTSEECAERQAVADDVRRLHASIGATQ